ncbi:MAG: hypothetical protein A2201_11810 [Alicyclobacillus sp. RIFOXYA1_FULL_53_8]|nr:MAG: hypothetical protein A2201_11810 [Alicyclobacillus sp. RIFOXYA1_FULL_53_8]
MDIIYSAQDLMQRIEKLTNDDSVCQVFVPGKGQLTIVLQAKSELSIAEEVQEDPELREMLQDSRKAHQAGDVMTTDELLKSISKSDFQWPTDA